MADWRVFTGSGRAPQHTPTIPAAPSWRRFVPLGKTKSIEKLPSSDDGGSKKRLAPFLVDHVIDMVNAAITLRRPLLIMGPPGSGKSTLADVIATELCLGPVLRWPITSSTRLTGGLYEYDAIGHVRPGFSSGSGDSTTPGDASYGPAQIGRFIRLGPLGTALLPWNRPRVLLIDEFDKSDIDLPGDLLHVLETGEYRIRELARLDDDSQGKPQKVTVLTSDQGDRAEVRGGIVRCDEFPIVLMTSNEERSFPPAFLRRCLRLKLDFPSPEQLWAIVAALVEPPIPQETEDLIKEFRYRVDQHRTVATDQLLNAVFLMGSCDPNQRGGLNEKVKQALLANLDET